MAFNIRSSGSYYATIDDSQLSTDRIYRLPDIDGTATLTLNRCQPVVNAGDNVVVVVTLAEPPEPKFCSKVTAANEPPLNQPATAVSG